MTIEQSKTENIFGKYSDTTLHSEYSWRKPIASEMLFKSIVCVCD